jgi:DNA-directed RNA polymerase subunit RPC12/RpoP
MENNGDEDMTRCRACGAKELFLEKRICQGCNKEGCIYCIPISIFRENRDDKLVEFSVCSKACLENFANRLFSWMQKFKISPDNDYYEPMHITYNEASLLHKDEVLSMRGGGAAFIIYYKRSMWKGVVPGHFEIKYDVYDNLQKEIDILYARKYEIALNYEKAAELYEKWGMYESADKARAINNASNSFTIKNIALNLNKLIQQLREGGIATTYRCPSCGASINISGETSAESLRFCNYCGTTLKTTDLVDFVQRIL